MDRRFPSPLRLNWLQQEQQASYLALAQVDGLFYLAGRGSWRPTPANVTVQTHAGRNEPVHVDIHRLPGLPHVAPLDEEKNPDGSTFGRAVADWPMSLRLYRLYEPYAFLEGLYVAHLLSDEEPDPTTLPEPEATRAVLSGKIHYSGLQHAAIRSGDLVALVIPGLGLDSSYISEWLIAGPAGNSGTYDHILTFEFDWLNNHMEQAAEFLASSLSAHGFGLHDERQLDLFAHGSGAIIARCLVEMYGGDQYVDRAFLAGPPNGGAFDVLPEQDPWGGLIMLALNFTDIWYPWPLAAWVQEADLVDSPMIEDLRPGSAILERLRRHDTRITTSYYVLLGEMEEPAPVEAERRPAEASPAGYGDWVTSAASMRALPDHLNPTTRAVSCHYFAYFSDKSVQSIWREWLAINDRAS